MNDPSQTAATGADAQDERPDYVDEVLTEARAVDVAVRLPRQRSRNRFSPVLIAVVRNERHRLERFLEHHRQRGVQEFVILDNASTDDSVAWLESQPDVFVAIVDRPFSWQHKQGWIHHVIERIGFDRWFLVLDADERLVYPGEEGHDLADLAAQMEAEGKWRIRGMLIDLYGRGPLLDSGQEDHDLFDSDSYQSWTNESLRTVTGGPRPRALASPDFDLRPELTKYPLFRIGPGELMANPHHLWPYGENYKSPCHLGILHDKFGADLLAKVELAIAENNYWNDSFEYRAYRAALAADPKLSLEYEGSRRYRSPADLEACGLVEPIDWAGFRGQRRRLRARDRWSPLAVLRRLGA